MSRVDRVPDPRDAQAVTNLLQAYSRATDAGDRASLAELFTPDAHWDGRAVGSRVTTGPDEAAEAICEHYDPARPMTHFVGPAVLETLDPAPDGVPRLSGWAWCIATRVVPDRPPVTVHFEYDDVVVRIGDRWLFERRVLGLRFRHPLLP